MRAGEGHITSITCPALNFDAPRASEMPQDIAEDRRVEQPPREYVNERSYVGIGDDDLIAMCPSLFGSAGVYVEPSNAATIRLHEYRQVATRASKG